MSVAMPPCEGKCLKIIQQSENEYKKHKAILEQKIEFLEDQLNDYRQREQDNRKINESIMITYHQNENLREQNAVKSMKLLRERQEEEIKRLKEMNHQELKRKEEEIQDYREKYQKSLIQNDRITLEFNKKCLQIKKIGQINLKKSLEEKEMEHEARLELLMQKIKQSEEMAEIYRDFVQKRRQMFVEDDVSDQIKEMSRSKKESPLISSSEDLKNRNAGRSKLKLKELQQNLGKNQHYLRSTRQSVKFLTKKINKAVVQLRGNSNRKVYERISAKLLG